MLTEVNNRFFTNGSVHALRTDDGYLVETTDTFLPSYTKHAVGTHQNILQDSDIGSRGERWMIGVSTQSGCPVRCKFCATGNMNKFRNLTADEIVDQVMFVLDKHPDDNPRNSYEFKINYTRMGECFLNIEAVKEAIKRISAIFPSAHHFVSTIGIKDSDFSWIKDNITLQVSVHSLKDEKRNWLIPFRNKMTIEELGQIRTQSNLKTTVNMTLVDEDDFDIDELKKYFDPEYHFIKLSPIYKNAVSESNNMGDGAITGVNIV